VIVVQKKVLHRVTDIESRSATVSKRQAPEPTLLVVGPSWNKVLLPRMLVSFFTRLRPITHYRACHRLSFYWVSTGASTCFALRSRIGRNWHHLLQYDEWCLNSLFPLEASLKQHTTKCLSFFSLSSSALYVFFFFWVAWSRRDQAASLANGPGPPMAARPRPTSSQQLLGPAGKGARRVGQRIISNRVLFTTTYFGGICI
jgi:hypothetical protein